MNVKLREFTTNQDSVSSHVVVSPFPSSFTVSPPIQWYGRQDVPFPSHPPSYRPPSSSDYPDYRESRHSGASPTGRALTLNGM